MCEFLSWIEMPNGELKYISNFELNTRDGAKLRKKLGDQFYDEIVGHGAIREYFGLESRRGKNCECNDFSTPDNFPLEIAKKIKNGEFSQLGIARQVFKTITLEKYREIETRIRNEYEKAIIFALDKYGEIELSAWKKYKEIKIYTWKEYKEVSLCAWKEYKKIGIPAWEKYKKVTFSSFWKLFEDPNNRTRVWC